MRLSLLSLNYVVLCKAAAESCVGTFAVGRAQSHGALPLSLDSGRIVQTKTSRPYRAAGYPAQKNVST